MDSVALFGPVAAAVMLGLWRGMNPIWRSWSRRRQTQRMIARVMGE